MENLLKFDDFCKNLKPIEQKKNVGIDEFNEGMIKPRSNSPKVELKDKEKKLIDLFKNYEYELFINEIENIYGFGLDKAEEFLNKHLEDWNVEDIKKLKNFNLNKPMPKLKEEDFLKNANKKAREFEKKRKEREREFEKKLRNIK
jgi:hypothetical protein